MITLYGSPMSSANRTHWMLEEVGVPYEYKVVSLRDPATRESFKPIYAGLKIPFLIDGDVRLAESMAINFYLAERYKPELMPTDLVARANVYQWSFFAITNLQPEGLKVLANTMFLPEPDRNPKLAEDGRREVARYVDVLEAALGGEYLVENRFTVADVNVGSVLNTASRGQGVTLPPRVAAYLGRLRERPAFQSMMRGPQPR